MKRLERKIFRLNEEIRSLKEQERLALEELMYHRHLHDDAERDAAVSDSPFDRADARVTGGDVARFERHLEELRSRRISVEAQRNRLLERLG